ncbi:hypothetical protein C8Q75DRAFT_808563 [Abortiporus biennis]|nr:hypothetical protein C8Q75DRAFT_808563 [Abortiporus biennis]
MHQIFNIAEILNAILQDLLKKEPSALSNLAQTCRFLEDPALDVLWNTQTSLIPLIRVASESIEETVKDGCTLIDPPEDNFDRYSNRANSIINLRKPFSFYEKGRISRYASRIQTFHPQLDMVPFIFSDAYNHPQSMSDGVLLELFRSHATALFSRLRKVAFPFLGLQNDRYFSLLCFFLNPELQELKITQHLPELMYSALELMPCRGLQKLELPMYSYMTTCSLPHSLGLHSMISQLHNLEELCCTMTLSHWKGLAAALPLLRVVEVSIVDDIQSGTTEQPPLDYLVLSGTAPLFASLVALKVRHSTLPSFIALLTSYRLPSVQYVQLLHMGSTQRDLVMFSTLPKVFQTHLSSSLLDIHIEVEVTTTLNRKLLSPFFQFHQIEQFILNADWKVVDLGDGDIEGLATAWPNLRYLNIQSQPSEGPDGELIQTSTSYVNSVTLKALFFIAHHCPHISSLWGLHLKADRWPDSGDVRPGGGYEAPNMKDLTFASTSSFNPQNIPNIALLLSDIFPNLGVIEISLRTVLKTQLNCNILPKWSKRFHLHVVRRGTGSDSIIK